MIERQNKQKNKQNAGVDANIVILTLIILRVKVPLFSFNIVYFYF